MADWLILPGILPLVIVAVFWARRLAARPASPRFVRWVPAALIFVALAAAGTTAYGLLRAQRAVAAANPSEKATILAQGISLAMNAAAVAYAAVVLALTSLAAASIVAWRRGRSDHDFVARQAPR